MAATRITRLISAKYGAGPTTIDGAVTAEWQHEGNVSDGMSDADVGPTSLDIRGWKTTGKITVDDHAAAVTLEDLATVTLLKFGYKIPGGSTKFVTFAKVNFGNVSEVPYPSGDSTGPTGRFAVDFEGVYTSGDTTPASLVTYGLS